MQKSQFPHWCRDPSITIHPLWRSEFGIEIRDYVMNRVQHQDEATKLINELGWRDYWHAVC